MHDESASLRIGSITLPNKLILAPMAGVTDRPFRRLCRELGAGLAVSEMVSADPRLRDTRKSRLRRDHTGEPEPRAVQIAGTDPAWLADCARFNVANGAGIIDINMGCPAKKVCNVMAGSALLRDEPLVARILEAVVKAVSVPVTLKIRTGWDRWHKNALTIARLAEASGIQALTIHGRTRACGYSGTAEYDTIRKVKAGVRIPVIANGDIDSPAKAREVLTATGADALMIGRGAQGNPWLFREIQHYLATSALAPGPTTGEVRSVLLRHLHNLYEFYGEYAGVRIARKHIGWYCRGLPDQQRASLLRAGVNRAERAALQIDLVSEYFSIDTIQVFQKRQAA